MKRIFLIFALIVSALIVMGQDLTTVTQNVYGSQVKDAINANDVALKAAIGVGSSDTTVALRVDINANTNLNSTQGDSLESHNTRFTAIEGDTAKWNTMLQDSLGQVADYYIVQSGDSVWAYPNVHTSLAAYRDTNLTGVINNCILQLTSGGLIKIGRGEFNHVRMIDVKYDSITVEGAGKYLTRLKLRPSHDAGGEGYMFYCGGANNFTLRNIQLDGNIENQTKVDDRASTTAKSQGVSARDSTGSDATDNLLVENCYIHHFARDGVIHQNGNNPIVRNCLFDNNGYAGVEYWEYTVGGRIENCEFNKTGISVYSDSTIVTGCSWHGLYYEHYHSEVQYAIGIEYDAGEAGGGPNNVIIRDCNISMSKGTYGIWGSGGTNNLTIDNVVIKDLDVTNSFGIILVDDTASVINNVTIYNAEGTNITGIGIHGSYKTSVKNCNIDSTSYPGIWLYDDSNFCTVMNNNISATLYGVNISSDSDDNLIIGNVLNASSIYALTNAGSSNLLRNNIINNPTTQRWIGDLGGNSYTRTAYADRAEPGCIISPGSKFVAVGSGDANRIIVLPEANAHSVGTVITGYVGSNGFELQVDTDQVASVQINGVTTNVEAAIPANRFFMVVLVDATHWILTTVTNLGAFAAAIVPDAI